MELYFQKMERPCIQENGKEFFLKKEKNERINWINLDTMTCNIDAFYLLESGSKRVRGTCIIQSVYPISCSDWSEERGNHCVDLSYKELKERYKNPHAWVLADVKPVENVWYYDHPNGAVIWVKDVSPLDEMQDERLRYGY